MDGLLPLLNLVRSLDWNSLLSGLIGGGFALAGVYAAARRDRQARQEESKAAFQRDTLTALQDAIEAHAQATQQIEFWRERPERMEASRRRVLGELFGTPEGDKLWPPPTPMSRVEHETKIGPLARTWHDTRYPVQRLLARVDNDCVRRDAEALVATARNAIQSSVMEEVNAIGARLNAQIGLLIRKGTVTKDGFVAPAGAADPAP